MEVFLMKMFLSFVLAILLSACSFAPQKSPATWQVRSEKTGPVYTLEKDTGASCVVAYIQNINGVFIVAGSDPTKDPIYVQKIGIAPGVFVQQAFRFLYETRYGTLFGGISLKKTELTPKSDVFAYECASFARSLPVDVRSAFGGRYGIR